MTDEFYDQHGWFELYDELNNTMSYTFTQNHECEIHTTISLADDVEYNTLRIIEQHIASIRNIDQREDVWT